MPETVEQKLAVRNAEGETVRGKAIVRAKKAGRTRAWRLFRLHELGATTRLQVPFTHDAVSFVIDTKLYRDARTDLVFVTSPRPDPLQVPLPRDLERWEPHFPDYSKLPPSCGPLKEILENSPNVGLLKKKGNPRVVHLGDISGDGYDQLEGHSEEALFAKAALLNLFWKMWRTHSTTATGAIGRPWFAYLRRILLIGRERIVAETDSTLLKVVTRIGQDPNDKMYGRQPDGEAQKHRANIEAAFTDNTVVDKKPLLSIKSNEQLGSLQLTVTTGTTPSGRQLTLLDADIDDHKGVRHVLDVLFEHPLTGGTNPFEIHEALALQFRTKNPAYWLVEKA